MARKSQRLAGRSSHHSFFVLAALLVSVLWVSAADPHGIVESITFDTAVTAPVYRIPKGLQRNEDLFRAGLQVLPEGFLVIGSLMLRGRDLGLSARQKSSLDALVLDAYSHIYADPAFTNVSSALPYCFARNKPRQGHYFLYRPGKLPKRPESIVFLHGYGGNFLFYMWALKEAFPQHVILVPSWNASGHSGSPSYIKVMLTHAERRLGTRLRKSWLMAISAGGRGGFMVYQSMFDRFQGYVCMAAVPDTALARRLSPDLRILMISGTKDRSLPIGIARRQAAMARKVIPSLVYKEIDSDHFFLLAKRKDTFEIIREFMSARNPLPPSPASP
jgi:pimeloyl-ACP methyl ester carboxylesterase